MYHNFSNILPLHLESLCIFVCAFFCLLGEGVCFLTKKCVCVRGGLNYSRVKFSLHLFIQEFQEEVGVDDCNCRRVCVVVPWMGGG